MPIYTGVGDEGRTRLFSGEQVSKTHPRVEACGAVDELSAVLGGLLTHLGEVEDELGEEVARVQTELIQLGARLGTEPGTPMAERLETDGIGIGRERVEGLEAAIERMEERLPTLTGFILPRGEPAAVWAHLARTVCRRAERRVVAVAEGRPAGEWPGDLQQAVVYLNRLSDYLFVVARRCNRMAGVQEVMWEG